MLEQIARVRALNDRFRTTGRGGKSEISEGVRAMGEPAVTEIVAMVAGKMSPEFLRSQEYDQIRMEMLAWMEAYADYGLIIDFPAWAIGEKGFIFTEFDNCLSETVRNAEYFRDHLTGETLLRLPTVVQGRSIYEALAWYNRIKAIETFPYAGWSFAGPVAYNPTIALRMILTLIREGD